MLSSPPVQEASQCTTINMPGSPPNHTYSCFAAHLPGSPPVLGYMCTALVMSGGYALPDGLPKKRQHTLQNKGGAHTSAPAPFSLLPTALSSYTTQITEHVMDIRLGRRKWDVQTIHNQFFNLADYVFSQHTHLVAVVTKVSLNGDIEYVWILFWSLAPSFANSWSLRDPVFCLSVSAVLCT